MDNSHNRLAIFLPSFAGGGAEKSMLTLAHGFANRGCAVDLVVSRREGAYLSSVDPRVRVIDLNASRVMSSVPGLVRYLRATRPDALLSTLDYANLVALWSHRLARVPTRTVIVEQNTISITCRESLQWRQRMIPRLVKGFYPWADHIVGNSQGVADDLAHITGLPGEQIHVIYNPVVTPALFGEAKVRPAHPWFAPGQPLVILAVGRLTAQKDFPTLIRAFAEVRRTIAARLIILGEGGDRIALEALIIELGLEADVSLPGFVDNPYGYMAHSALFVLSSRWEGLPTVLIEALACGTRVVATDCPSGPNEILANGKHGVLVPIHDVPALVAAITAAFSGSTPTSSQESWQPYDIETVVDQYARILFDGQQVKTFRAATV